MKTITLDVKQTKDLVELLERGKAYTDAFYKPSPRLSKIFKEIIKQLEEQGADYKGNGKLSYKKPKKEHFACPHFFSI